MKIYLASPFFHTDEITVYDKVIQRLREQQLDVFVPREHEIPGGWDLENCRWGECVFAVDYLALSQSDIVIVLNFGMYSDSGTAWECGCAYGMGKKIINVLCGDKETEYSLMMLNGTNTVVDFEELQTIEFEKILTMEKEKNSQILQK